MRKLGLTPKDPRKADPLLLESLKERGAENIRVSGNQTTAVMHGVTRRYLCYGSWDRYVEKRDEVRRLVQEYRRRNAVKYCTFALGPQAKVFHVWHLIEEKESARAPKKS
jgi:hypothetical protein